MHESIVKPNRPKYILFFLTLISISSSYSQNEIIETNAGIIAKRYILKKST